jgi:hypothetical protein
MEYGHDLGDFLLDVAVGIPPLPGRRHHRQPIRKAWRDDFIQELPPLGLADSSPVGAVMAKVERVANHRLIARLATGNARLNRNTRCGTARYRRNQQGQHQARGDGPAHVSVPHLLAAFSRAALIRFLLTCLHYEPLSTLSPT